MQWGHVIVMLHYVMSNLLWWYTHACSRADNVTSHDGALCLIACFWFKVHAPHSSVHRKQVCTQVGSSWNLSPGCCIDSAVVNLAVVLPYIGEIGEHSRVTFNGYISSATRGLVGIGKYLDSSQQGLLNDVYTHVHVSFMILLWAPEADL